jgi:hypothetical protein
MSHFIQTMLHEKEILLPTDPNILEHVSGNTGIF